MRLLPGVAIPRDAVPGTPGAAEKIVQGLRRMTFFSIGQLLLAAIVVAIFPENLLAGREGDPVAAVLTAGMGGMVLVALVVALVVERVLRSPATSFLGLQLPAHPLARYRAAKTVGIALRDAAGSVGFILGLTIADHLAYAAILLAVAALALARPRLADLPPEEPAATMSPAPG